MGQLPCSGVYTTKKGLSVRKDPFTRTLYENEKIYLLNYYMVNVLRLGLVQKQMM